MITLSTESGQTIEVEIRSLKVREYPAAYRVWSNREEWRLITLGVVEQTPPLKPDWTQDLTPESYELAMREFSARNQFFFGWCGRRLSQELLERATLGMLENPSLAPGVGGSSSPISPRNPG